MPARGGVSPRPGGRSVLAARGLREPGLGRLPREQVAELQRSRLLAAAVGEYDERGFVRTSVGQITTRARVSRRTFYDLFADREECLAAVVEEAVALLAAELDAAGLGGLGWRERVRVGVWKILSFFDREPALARVCVVQALRGGPVVLERREVLLGRLAAVVDEGRLEGPRGEACGPLTAEGVVGAAFAIVYRRLLRGEPGPLTDLWGELVGMIVLPYLGPAAAGRERARPAPAVPVAVVRRVEAAPSAVDPLDDVPMRLTYRTVRVLEGVAELGGGGVGPSNRQVADHAGVQDPGQISKLLRRLEGLGLLVNRGQGAHAKGEPNAWALTPKGQQVTHSIRVHARHRREAA